MSQTSFSPFIPFLFQLFIGTVCSSMVMPFMGYFIVNELGHEPWTISVYAGIVALLATTTNRYFARRVDDGASSFSFIGIAVGGYMLGSFALALNPSFLMVMTFGVIGFGISTSAISTMFSLGGGLAEQQLLDQKRANAYMRATTSTAWMVGPAFSFLIADLYSGSAVFYFSASLSIIWASLWWWATPKIKTTNTKGTLQAVGSKTMRQGLWLAVAFVFCLSSAHSLTLSALPLFYVQEVGLPGYAPGTAFSMKTLIEVIAIFCTPFLITKFGLRNSLIATASLAVITILYLSTVQTYLQMLVGAAMEGLYYGLYASLGISFIQSYAKGRSARATALYWNTLIISGVLAGPIAGMIAQLYNFKTVIQLACIVSIIAVLVLLLGALFSSKTTEHEADTKSSSN